MDACVPSLWELYKDSLWDLLKANEDDMNTSGKKGRRMVLVTTALFICVGVGIIIMIDQSDKVGQASWENMSRSDKSTFNLK